MQSVAELLTVIGTAFMSLEASWTVVVAMVEQLLIKRLMLPNNACYYGKCS